MSRSGYLSLSASARQTIRSGAKSSSRILMSRTAPDLSLANSLPTRYRGATQAPHAMAATESASRRIGPEGNILGLGISLLVRRTPHPYQSVANRDRGPVRTFCSGHELIWY